MAASYKIKKKKKKKTVRKGSLWSRSYGSWIYNYLYAISAQNFKMIANYIYFIRFSFHFEYNNNQHILYIV